MLSAGSFPLATTDDTHMNFILAGKPIRQRPGCGVHRADDACRVLGLVDANRGGRRWIGRGAIALLALAGSLLAGCASPLAPAGPPPPFSATVTIQTAASVNPDAQGRPSPVFVRLYQLKDAGVFMNAAYEALHTQEAATLGASIIAREELPLGPGELKALQVKIEPETRFIGVIADFRDIANAQWRAVTTAPEKRLKDLLREKRLSVRLEGTQVSIAEPN